MIKSRGLASIVVIASTLLIGYFDYITGTEVRIIPLYYAPLLLAATCFDKRGAVAASLLATVAWHVSNDMAGRVYSSPYVGALNFISQFFSFAVISLLVAYLRNSIFREHELSQVDTLTGVLNSEVFHEKVEPILALCRENNHPATLVFLDLDNFRRVNESIGYKRGNRLLRKVADTLIKGVRPKDLVARISGNEFVIFLPEAGKSQTESLLEKLSGTLIRSDEFKEFEIGASFGAVVYQVAPADIGVMIKEASILMYAVKASGKNAVNIRCIP